jgi:predicted O-methyltransferase YrrM
VIAGAAWPGATGASSTSTISWLLWSVVVVGKRLRAAVRIRLVRVVDEVVTAHRHALEAVLATHYRAMEAALTRHRREVEAALTAEVDRAVQAVRDAELRSRRDLLAAGERAAAASSARFAQEAMPTAPTFEHPIATLEYALSLAPSDGMALEFGVATGRTLEVIAAARKNGPVFGFDSFQGLPEAWRTNIPAGTFKVDQLPDVPGAELIVGLFADTLPGFLASHPDPVAFVHLDADLYSSTVTVLEHVGPRLAPGSVIIFDEYFNYPGWEQHEHRAWQEFVTNSGLEFEYVAYTCDHEQVAVVITKI